VTSHYATGGTVVYNDCIAIAVGDDDPMLVPSGTFHDRAIIFPYPPPSMLASLKLIKRD